MERRWWWLIVLYHERKWCVPLVPAYQLKLEPATPFNAFMLSQHYATSGNTIINQLIIIIIMQYLTNSLPFSLPCVSCKKEIAHHAIFSGWCTTVHTSCHHCGNDSFWEVTDDLETSHAYLPLPEDSTSLDWGDHSVYNPSLDEEVDYE
jgi:hypothetical protein